MGSLKKIEPRTNRFIDDYNRLSESGNLPSNVDLARIMGIRSKSTISEIINRRQNIQPEHWEKFKAYFGIKEEPGSDNSEHRSSAPAPADLLTTLLHKLITVSDTTNRILERQEKDIVDKIQTIDANLNLVTVQAESIKLDVESARSVVLKSLARLEKKKEDQLVNEADSIKTGLLVAKDELYRTSAKGIRRTQKQR